MRFSLSALQFGKELLEVKSKAEQKQFSRDICFFRENMKRIQKIIFFMIYIRHSAFSALEFHMKCCSRHNEERPRTKQFLCGDAPCYHLIDCSGIRAGEGILHIAAQFKEDLVQRIGGAGL